MRSSIVFSGGSSRIGVASRGRTARRSVPTSETLWTTSRLISINPTSPKHLRGRAISPKAPRRQSRTAQISVPTWRACSMGRSIVFSGGSGRIGVASRGAGPLGDRSLPRNLIRPQPGGPTINPTSPSLIFNKYLIETPHSGMGPPGHVFFARASLLVRQGPPIGPSLALAASRNRIRYAFPDLPTDYVR